MSVNPTMGAGNVAKVMGRIKPKNLSPKQAAMEEIAGKAYALNKSPEEVKERVMREALLGNTDFARGANEVLAKDAAKKIYKG